MAVRGLSLITGGFPDEFKIIDLASSGEFAELKKLINWKVILYFAGIVFLFVAGTCAQRKMLKGKELFEKKEKEEKEKQDPFLAPVHY